MPTLTDQEKKELTGINMAKITNLKRIVVEEFDPEMQDTISKLSFSLNPLLEQITEAFNKNITFDNLNQDIISFVVEVDATGKPKASTQFKYNLKNAPRCIIVGSAESNELTAAPFITYSVSNQVVTVNKIFGLPADKKIRITVILIG